MANHLVKHFKDRLVKLQHEFEVTDYELQAVTAVLDLSPEVHKEFNVDKGRLEELKYRETILKSKLVEIQAEYSSVTVAYNHATLQAMRGTEDDKFDS